MFSSFCLHCEIEGRRIYISLTGKQAAEQLSVAAEATAGGADLDSSAGSGRPPPAEMSTELWSDILLQPRLFCLSIINSI